MTPGLPVVMSIVFYVCRIPSWTPCQAVGWVHQQGRPGLCCRDHGCCLPLPTGLQLLYPKCKLNSCQIVSDGVNYSCVTTPINCDLSKCGRIVTALLPFQFTTVRFARTVEPNRQATFEYAFTPSETFNARPFGLTINLNYKDAVSMINHYHLIKARHQQIWKCLVFLYIPRTLLDKNIWSVWAMLSKWQDGIGKS